MRRDSQRYHVDRFGTEFRVIDHFTLILSRPYTLADADALRNWLIERANGYPPRDLPWPSVHAGPHRCSGCEGGTRHKSVVL